MHGILVVSLRVRREKISDDEIFALLRVTTFVGADGRQSDADAQQGLL